MVLFKSLAWRYWHQNSHAQIKIYSDIQKIVGGAHPSIDLNHLIHLRIEKLVIETLPFMIKKITR